LTLGRPTVVFEVDDDPDNEELQRLVPA